MFYKPAYCCNCGEKIETAETLPWKTSGRFCDVCKKEFSFQEWFPTVLMVLFSIIGLFGIGSYLKTDDKTNAVALKQNKISSLETSAKTESLANPAQNSDQIIVQKSEPIKESNLTSNANKNLVEKRKIEPVSAEIEKVYFCGAATKKGTPCSRKVKGGGRCWQHKGQDAILPPEKLLITQ